MCSPRIFKKWETRSKSVTFVAVVRVFERHHDFSPHQPHSMWSARHSLVSLSCCHSLAIIGDITLFPWFPTCQRLPAFLPPHSQNQRQWCIDPQQSPARWRQADYPHHWFVTFHMGTVEYHQGEVYGDVSHIDDSKACLSRLESQASVDEIGSIRTASLQGLPRSQFCQHSRSPQPDQAEAIVPSRRSHTTDLSRSRNEDDRKNTGATGPTRIETPPSMSSIFW